MSFPICRMRSALETLLGPEQSSLRTVAKNAMARGIDTVARKSGNSNFVPTKQFLEDLYLDCLFAMGIYTMALEKEAPSQLAHVSTKGDLTELLEREFEQGTEKYQRVLDQVRQAMERQSLPRPDKVLWTGKDESKKLTAWLLAETDEEFINSFFYVHGMNLQKKVRQDSPTPPEPTHKDSKIEALINAELFHVYNAACRDLLWNAPELGRTRDHWVTIYQMVLMEMGLLEAELIPSASRWETKYVRDHIRKDRVALESVALNPSSNANDSIEWGKRYKAIPAELQCPDYVAVLILQLTWCRYRLETSCSVSHFVFENWPAQWLHSGFVNRKSRAMQAALKSTVYRWWQIRFTHFQNALFTTEEKKHLKLGKEENNIPTELNDESLIKSLGFLIDRGIFSEGKKIGRLVLDRVKGGSVNA